MARAGRAGRREAGRLLGLQVVKLVDEALKLRDGMVALVAGEALIDGEGHRFDGGAHLADGVLIGLGGVPVRIDEDGTQFTGDALGGAGLMEDGQEFLLALLSIGDPDLLRIGKRETPFTDLSLLVFGQGSQPVFEPVNGVLSPLLEPIRRGGLHEAGGFLVILLQRFFECPHLSGIDGGEKDAAVGDEPVEQVGTQSIVAVIDPVDILAREPPFDSLPDLQEEVFILRNGFVAVPGEQRREPLGQIAPLC